MSQPSASWPCAAFWTQRQLTRACGLGPGTREGPRTEPHVRHTVSATSWLPCGGRDAACCALDPPARGEELHCVPLGCPSSLSPRQKVPVICRLAWGLPSGWWPGCRAGRPMATPQLWILPPRSGTQECARVCVHSHLPPVPGGGSTCPCSSLWACPLPSQTQQRQEAEATMASVHGAQSCQPASLFRSLNALLEVCSVRGQLCHPQGETLFSGEVSMWSASRGAGPSPWPTVCCTRPRSRSCTASRELPMLWGRHQTRDGLTGPRELTQGPRGRGQGPGQSYWHAWPSAGPEHRSPHHALCPAPCASEGAATS